MMLYFNYTRRCNCGFKQPIVIQVRLPLDDSNRKYFSCPECGYEDQDLLIILLKLLKSDIRSIHFAVGDH